MKSILIFTLFYFNCCWKSRTIEDILGLGNVRVRTFYNFFQLWTTELQGGTRMQASLNLLGINCYPEYSHCSIALNWPYLCNFYSLWIQNMFYILRFYWDLDLDGEFVLKWNHKINISTLGKQRRIDYAQNRYQI